jgi:hypothetical protein
MAGRMRPQRHLSRSADGLAGQSNAQNPGVSVSGVPDHLGACRRVSDGASCQELSNSCGACEVRTDRRLPVTERVPRRSVPDCRHPTAPGRPARHSPAPTGPCSQRTAVTIRPPPGDYLHTTRHDRRTEMNPTATLTGQPPQPPHPATMTIPGRPPARHQPLRRLPRRRPRRDPHHPHRPPAPRPHRQAVRHARLDLQPRRMTRTGVMSLESVADMDLLLEVVE